MHQPGTLRLLSLHAAVGAGHPTSASTIVEIAHRQLAEPYWHLQRRLGQTQAACTQPHTLIVCIDMRCTMVDVETYFGCSRQFLNIFQRI
jgi:hypothetical protein